MNLIPIQILPKSILIFQRIINSWISEKFGIDCCWICNQFLPGKNFLPGRALFFQWAFSVISWAAPDSCTFSVLGFNPERVLMNPSSWWRPIWLGLEEFRLASRCSVSAGTFCVYRNTQPSPDFSCVLELRIQAWIHVERFLQLARTDLVWIGGIPATN